LLVSLISKQRNRCREGSNHRSGFPASLQSDRRKIKILVRWLGGIVLSIAVGGAWYVSEVSQVKRDRALGHAIIDGDLRLAKRLVKEGADPSSRWNPQPLDTSLRSTFERAIDRMVNSTAAELQSGSPMLSIATEDGRADLVEVLTQSGANPNVSGGDDESSTYLALRSPLGIAVLMGYPEITSILLRHGADPNVRDAVGTTPLICAVLLYLQIEELAAHRRRALQFAHLPYLYPSAMFLGWYRSADMKSDRAMISRLHGSVGQLHKLLCLENIRLLVKNGAKPEAKDSSGKSALDYAKSVESRELLTVLGRR